MTTADQAAPQAPAVPAPPPAGEPAGRRERLVDGLTDVLVRSIGPIVLALVFGGLLLLALGRNPLTFYRDILRGGIELGFWEDSVMRMAPLLLIALGLIVVFRAAIWNLGMDGQFLLSGAIISGVAPSLVGVIPTWLMLVLMFLLAAAVGAAWTVVPALMRAHYGVNEIITTLMTAFIGINLANYLIKGPFQDFSVNVPQTRVLPFEDLLPTLPGTRIHVGVIVAGVAAVAVWFLMSRTSFGLRLHILGVNARAAAHVGIRVPRLIVTAFMISGAFVGLAAASEILGIWGYVRSDWNPAFGLLVVPLVFLARMNALAVIPFVAFLAVVSIGGDFATREADLSSQFTLAVVGFILLFMGITEVLGRRRDLGQSYLPTLRRRPPAADPTPTPAPEATP